MDIYIFYHAPFLLPTGSSEGTVLIFLVILCVRSSSGLDGGSPVSVRGFVRNPYCTVATGYRYGYWTLRHSWLFISFAQKDEVLSRIHSRWSKVGSLVHV